MKYYSYARPIMPGGYPKIKGNSVIEVVNYTCRDYTDKRFVVPVWGYVEYEDIIPMSIANEYELMPECTVVRKVVQDDVMCAHFRRNGIEFEFAYNCSIRFKDDIDNVIDNQIIIISSSNCEPGIICKLGLDDSEVFFYDTEHDSPMDIDKEDFVVDYFELINYVIY